MLFLATYLLCLKPNINRAKISYLKLEMGDCYYNEFKFKNNTYDENGCKNSSIIIKEFLLIIS